jgi:hypothetical protein
MARLSRRLPRRAFMRNASFPCLDGSESAETTFAKFDRARQRRRYWQCLLRRLCLLFVRSRPEA